MRARTVPQAGWSFEYLMWIFTRISGIALFLLSFIGFAGAFILGARLYLTNGGYVDIGALARWTFFPNPNHVVNTNIPDVAVGWANAWWQIVQYVILFMGVTHGLNGLRVVIEDYLDRTWSRILLRGLLFLVWLFVMLFGIYVIQAS